MLGLYMSLILLALAGYALYFFGQNMFEKKNPTIVQSEQSGRLYEEFLPVPQQQVFVGVRNLTSGKYFMDSSVYRVSIVVNPQFGMNVTPEPCVPQKLSQIYDIQEQVWCFKTQNDSFLPIKSFNSVNLYVSICKNTTGIVCRTQEELDKIISNTVVDVYWNDVSLDFYDYESPIKTNLNFYTFSMLRNLSPRVDLVFRSVEIKTDSGILNEDYRTESTVGVDSTFSAIIDPIPNYDAIFLISLASTGRLTAVMRRYQKIQDVIAQVVSIFNIVFLIFKLIAQNYTDYQMYAEVSNECMDIITTYSQKTSEDSPSLQIDNRTIPDEHENLESLQKNQNARADLKINEVELNNHVNQIRNRDSEAQTSILISNDAYQDIQKGSQITKKKVSDKVIIQKNENNFSSMNSVNRKISSRIEKVGITKNKQIHTNKEINVPCVFEKERVNLSFSKWLKSFFRKDETFIKINELKDHIDAGFDVVNIFLKLHEVDRLKEILLTNEQRFVFDRFKKPQFRFRKDGNFIKLNLLKKESPVYNSCDEAMKTILSKPKLKQIDKNIIKMKSIVWDN